MGDWIAAGFLAVAAGPFLDLLTELGWWIAGATLGAFILVPLSELLRGIGGLRIVFYGLFLVIFIVVVPEGIFHYIQRKYQQFERWVEVEG